MNFYELGFLLTITFFAGFALGEWRARRRHERNRSAWIGNLEQRGVAAKRIDTIKG